MWSDTLRPDTSTSVPRELANHHRVVVARQAIGQRGLARGLGPDDADAAREVRAHRAWQPAPVPHRVGSHVGRPNLAQGPRVIHRNVRRTQHAREFDAVGLRGEEVVGALRQHAADRIPPDPPEVGGFPGILRDLVRDVDHVRVREHLAHPRRARLARNRLVRHRCHDHRQVTHVVPREIDQVAVPERGRVELPENHARRTAPGLDRLVGVRLSACRCLALSRCPLWLPHPGEFGDPNVRAPVRDERQHPPPAGLSAFCPGPTRPRRLATSPPPTRGRASSSGSPSHARERRRQPLRARTDDRQSDAPRTSRPARAAPGPAPARSSTVSSASPRSRRVAVHDGACRR